MVLSVLSGFHILFLLFQVAMLAEPVLTRKVVVDVFKATGVRRIFGIESGSLWEPIPPKNSDFYVLGQYAHNRGGIPKPGTDLFVGRSVNGSLAEPVKLYGRWEMIKNKLYIWSMHCPSGYVSLGSIATKNKTRPDKKRYRCVKRGATNFAHRKDILYSSLNGYKLSTLGSYKGWHTIFFIVTYPLGKNYSISAHTLRYWNVVKNPGTTTTTKLPVTVTSQLGNVKTSSTTTTSPTTGRRDKNFDLKVAVAVVVGAVFVFLMALIFCVRYRRQFLKGVPPSNSTTVTTTTGSEYEVARYVGNNNDQNVYGNAEAEVKENILYGHRESPRELKENVLYSTSVCEYSFARDVNPYELADPHEGRNGDYEQIDFNSAQGRV